MAIVKLVCQGCGANLDVLDTSEITTCGYCGTQNHLRQQQQPQPPPPQQIQTQAQMHMAHAQKATQGARRGVLAIILITALAPILLGGFITYMVTKTTSSVVEGFEGFGGVGAQGRTINQGKGRAQAKNVRRYRWHSQRPFVTDVNGDGSEDLVGLIEERGRAQVLLTAMSGSDWSTLWETELGDRAQMPGQPVLRLDPESSLALFALGATLHAYELETGKERWIASLPDKVDRVFREGDHLWVATIDKSGSLVELEQGKVSPADAKRPSSDSKVLRTDEGYELIPEERTLDLKTNQYKGLKVEAAFCNKEDAPVALGRRSPITPGGCKGPHGLAYAVRRKGTQVPFLVGYNRKTKAERWRVQLTKAGTLETVESGFGQPRAELAGDDAIISFVPTNDDEHPRIRRISLKDGSTKWEVKLSETSTENVDGIVAGQERVFVTFAGIQVFSFADGTHEATLGTW